MTPEYNGFVTPLLLNMLCWVSRPLPGDNFGNVFQGRPVALAASSPGRLGAMRVIPRLRDLFTELGIIAVPGFVTLADASPPARHSPVAAASTALFQFLNMQEI